MSLKVRSDVTIYEIDGEETDMDRPALTVEAHWNDRNMVVVKVPGAESVTVVAMDLEAAISNATNTGHR